MDENSISIHGDAFLGRPDACVVLIPRELQPNAERVDSRFVFTGPCVDMCRMTGRTPETDDERPLVYVALGTAYTENLPIYRTSVAALGAEYRLVIATGKVDPSRLGPLPTSATAARKQPQLDVLAHADVFITHAGMGSAAESLWFGVPTVAIPQAVDQFTNASLLQAAGTGVHLPDKHVSADSLRAAVAEALARRTRARALRDEVRRDRGPAATADAVERAARR